MVKPTFSNLPEEKRQRIIDVALEEFAARPFTKASLSNIVARAGIAKGSMYQYFEDKKDLFLYLLDLAIEQKLDYIKREVNLEAGFFDAFEQTLRVGTKFNLSHPQLGSLMANIMEPSSEEVLREVSEKSRHLTIEFFQNMISKGQVNGEIRKDVDPRFMATLMYSLLGTGLTEYVLESIGVTTKEYLSKPELQEKITQDTIDFIIAQVMSFLQSGLRAERG